MTVAGDLVTRSSVDRERIGTSREFTPASASPDRTTVRRVTHGVESTNSYPFEDIDTISPQPMLFISDDQAHSRPFSEDAHRRAAEPETLHRVPGTGHVDLDDRVDLIPFDLLHETSSSGSTASTESPSAAARGAAERSTRGGETHRTAR